MSRIALGFAGLLLGGLTACTPASQRTFVGRVYDGATGERITGYDLWIEHDIEVELADVDERGRYHVGPLPEGRDFSVGIEADGYRNFLSHNPAFVDSSPEVTEVRYYDAFLFPTDLASPPVSFSVALADSQDPAEGRLRLRPTADSTLADADDYVGIDGQVWVNDEDLQVASIGVDFTGGQVSFEQGAFVYGVNYAVSVYAVSGYRDMETSWQSGLHGSQSWTLQPLMGSALQVNYLSTDSGEPSPDGSLVIVFNQAVELFGGSDHAEIIDAAFSISTSDEDLDGEVNQLNEDVTDGAQERGTTIAVTGAQLTFSWNPDIGLAQSDPDDPITQLHWSGLNSIEVMPLGGAASQRATLSTLLGTSVVTVNVSPPL